MQCIISYTWKTSTHIIVHFYVGDERPKARDYQKFLMEYCLEWKSIGLNLGINQAVLNVIEAGHPNQHKDCFRLTLDKWLQQDIKATWSKLELAITNANRMALQWRRKQKKVGGAQV